MKNNSAPGPDNILASFLKNDSCIGFMLSFFNQCLLLGQIPSLWSQSVIQPIPKAGGNPLCPADYRGISLQSIVMKVFCSVLNNRLCDYLESNDLLAEEQNGFRKGRSCQDHIFTLNTILDGRKALRRSTFTCFIDFKKAFDSVNRALLWHKLQSLFGIQGQFLSMIKALYQKVSSTVKINSQLSDWFDVNCGVKQGCVLSPTLFSMFINDLVDSVRGTGRGLRIKDTNIDILMYADDVVILAETEGDLQVILNRVNSWCESWGISINVKKTKVLHFRQKRTPLSDFSFKLGNQHIEYAHEYKYLGFWFNEFLDLDNSIQRVFNSGNQALGAVIAKAKAAGGLPFSVFTRLYDASVLSICNYSAHIWAHRKNLQLNKLQNNALKFFFGLGNAAPLAALEGDSGWPPLQMQLQYTLVKYWVRVCEMPLSRIPKLAYVWSRELADSGKKSWGYHIRELVEGLKLHEFHECLPVGNPPEVYSIVWDALADKFTQSWRHSVQKVEASASENGGKLAMYRQLKLFPGTEPYVRASLPVGVRRVVAGLRAGCLPLQIELGRYTSPKTPLNQRTCKLCNSGTEDQEHFLLLCPSLHEPRAKLFTTLHSLDPNFLSYSPALKCLYLLHPQQFIHCITFGLFHMYVCRQNLLYNIPSSS